MAHSYRKFGERNPRTYTLIFSETLAAPKIARAGSRKEGALPTALMLVSYLHGFLSMGTGKNISLRRKSARGV